jgi:hypothetical protein
VVFTLGSIKLLLSILKKLTANLRKECRPYEEELHQLYPSDRAYFRA